MDIQVKDIVTLKKQHPCGSHDWEVLRMGADFSVEVYGMRHQDHDSPDKIGKKRKGNQKKALKNREKHAIITSRGI